jgi:hypothetical protein
MRLIDGQDLGSALTESRGADGTADNPNGQDGGLLFGNGGAGWTSTTAGVGGGNGGNGGLQRPWIDASVRLPAGEELANAADQSSSHDTKPSPKQNWGTTLTTGPGSVPPSPLGLPMHVSTSTPWSTLL